MISRYSLWRLPIQNGLLIDQYLQTPKMSRGPSLDLPIAIDWQPPDIASKEASKEIFASECLSSFWAIYEYAKTVGNKNTFCIETPYNADRREAFSRNWAVDQGNDRERIFIWSRQSCFIARLSHSERIAHLKKSTRPFRT